MPEITLKDLPLMAPPRSAWPQLEAQLRASKRPPATPRWLFALAAAATLACVALLPRLMPAPAIEAPAVAVETPAPAAMPGNVATLQTESAQLEALIAWSRNDAVELGSFGSLSDSLERRVASIDALLARDDLDPEAALPLWQERVLRLRQLLDLENTQQLLAANGDADPGAPVLAF